jgi:hypothetical protein
MSHFWWLHRLDEYLIASEAATNLNLERFGLAGACSFDLQQLADLLSGMSEGALGYSRY